MLYHWEYLGRYRRNNDLEPGYLLIFVIRHTHAGWGGEQRPKFFGLIQEPTSTFTVWRFLISYTGKFYKVHLADTSTKVKFFKFDFN
jgi:hypothetical protein